MPFMLGPSPIRRTLKYLNKGDIIFRDIVKIFTVNYTKNDDAVHHQGAKEFVYWHLPQIQFKNPDLQCITYKNITPSPFIRIFLDSGKSLLIDCDSRSKDEIYDHLKDFVAICKSKEEIEHEQLMEQKLDNPANFGYYCERQCICEVFNQVPCPGVVPMPIYRRGCPPVHIKKIVRVPDFIKFEELEKKRLQESKFK